MARLHKLCKLHRPGSFCVNIHWHDTVIHHTLPPTQFKQIHSHQLSCHQTHNCTCSHPHNAPDNAHHHVTQTVRVMAGSTAQHSTALAAPSLLSVQFHTFYFTLFLFIKWSLHHYPVFMLTVWRPAFILITMSTPHINKSLPCTICCDITCSTIHTYFVQNSHFSRTGCRRIIQKTIKFTPANLTAFKMCMKYLLLFIYLQFVQ